MHYPIIKKIPYLLAAFLFGLGYIKPSVSYLILFTLFFYVSRNAHILIKNKVGAVVGILWVAFFLAYFYFFIPPDLPWGKIPLDFYRYVQMAMPIVLIYHLILLLPDNKDAVNLVVSITMGMMAFALANTVYTLILLDPPYYGKAYHSIHKFVYNSPGTTILGSMLPITLIALWKKQQRLINIKNTFLFFSIFCGLTVSIIFSARTTIFIISIAIFLKILFNFKLTDINRKNIIFVLITFLALVFSLLLLSYFFNDFIKHLSYRISQGEYSVKIQHHIDYWDQVKNNFWIYPNANFVAKYDWFHNFFFDNHRTSGPITAIISYLIFLLAFLKAFYDFYSKREFGREIFILFIIIIPFLITTIPWESSESQMIGLYAGIVGLVFKKKSKMKYYK